MTRSEWIALAEALAKFRASVAANEPRAEMATAAHDRKLIYFAQLDAIDRAARTVAAAIEPSACSFDRKRFIRIVGCYPSRTPSG